MIHEYKEHISGLYSAKCDLNIDVLQKSCLEMKQVISSSFKFNEDDYQGTSTSTTKLYKQYNFFLYPFPQFHELYWNVSEMFHTCLTHYYNGRVDKKFMIQAWMNVYEKGEHIGWHSHTRKDIEAWHGFFCVDVEPNSYTSYKWEEDSERNGIQIDIQSKNNLIVFGLSNGDKHRSSVWNRKKPRITIAFDAIPIDAIYMKATREYGSYENAMKKSSDFVNHWIPI